MMSKTSTDQYGRKSWNVEAFEEEARKGSKKRKVDIVLDKDHRINNEHASTYISHRTRIIDEAIGKVKVHSIIDPTDLLTGGHVRFGFTCPVCSFSFKDNLALIDHINSPQHLAKVKHLSRKNKPHDNDDDDDDDDEDTTEELEGGIRRATLAHVINTMEAMVEKQIKDRTPDEVVSIQERIERRKRFELEWKEKRRRRRAKNKKLKNKKQLSEDSESDNEVARTMGFLAFGDK